MSQMTPRERWLATLNHKPVDRLPTDYRATDEFHARFVKDLGIAGDEALSRKLGIDRTIGLGPRQKIQHHPADASANIWGLRHISVDYGTGAYLEVANHPLAHMTSVDEVHAYQWPTVDYLDFSHLKDQVAKSDNYHIRRGGGYEPFLLYCSLRGIEQAYEDLLVNEDIAEAILEHIFQYHYASNRLLYQCGGVDLTSVADDLGSQTGPLMSLETYRKFLLPRQKKMADLARSFGIYIDYHTDGAAGVFLPDLVNVVGINMLNPIQWRCSTMERETLARDWGKRIVFHGAIDNQYTLPFGTPEQVRQEVQDCARLFAGCRWICAPCHNIQPNTPTANVVAMYEEAARVSWH